jgi:hypothetical protein
VTIIGMRFGVFGTVLPAAAILAVTLLAAVRPRLQGILITATGIAFFIFAMLLMPRLKLQHALAPIKPPVTPAQPNPEGDRK